MRERLLALLTVTFQGVPIGTFNLYEADREQLIEPLLPPELRPMLDRTPTLHAGQFSALPAFQTVTSPLFRITEAMQAARAAWRQVLAQPPSPASRQASNAAWDQLMALERVLHDTRARIAHELALNDEGGELVPASLLDVGVNPSTVRALFHDMPADVLARLRRRRASGSAEGEPPAPND